MEADTDGPRRSRRIWNHQIEEIRADEDVDNPSFIPLAPRKKKFKKDSRTWLHKSSTKRRMKDLDIAIISDVRERSQQNETAVDKTSVGLTTSDKTSLTVADKTSLTAADKRSISSADKRSISSADKRTITAAVGFIYQDSRSRNIFKRFKSRSFSSVINGNTASSQSIVCLNSCDSSPAIVDSGFGSFTEDNRDVNMIAQPECPGREETSNERITFDFESEVDRLAFPEDTTRLQPSEAFHCLATCSPDRMERGSGGHRDSHMTDWRSIHSDEPSSTTQVKAADLWELVSRSDVSVSDIVT